MTDQVFDYSFKGIPHSLMNERITDVGQHNLNILNEDFMLPVAILKQSALDHNSAWMTKFLSMSGALLCPHGKTTMSPELIKKQLDDGAWGITAATSSHVRVYRHYGINRIIMANQLVGSANINYILDELQKDPDFDFYCLVDSVSSVETLVKHVSRKQLSRPLQLLLEVGADKGRTGVRDYDTGLDIAKAIKNAGPLLSLRGIEGFEGIFSPETNSEIRIEEMLKNICALAVECEKQQYFGSGNILLTAGGSAYFDMAAQTLEAAGLKSPYKTILRSGCYLTHDSGTYKHQMARLFQRSPDLKPALPDMLPALEIWGYIQSIPEEGRALATFGKRDVSYDIEMPHLLYWFRPGIHTSPQQLNFSAKVEALNDQHAYINLPEPHPLMVGDMIAVGISHPCTTFDKWKAMLVVDDDYNVTSAITTRF